MTTIFSGAYENNLARINARGSTSKVEKKDKQQSFQTVLADLEKKPKPKELQVKQALPAPPAAVSTPVETLSNFTLGDKQAVPRENPPVKPIRIEIPTEYLNQMKLSHGIGKAEESSVKRLAPQPVLEKPVAEAPLPKQPDLLSAAAVRPPQLQQYSDKKDRVHDIIETAGRFHGVDPQLSLAVAFAESSFRTNVVSQDKHESKGLFQLLDTTGREMLGRLGLEDEEYDPFDPALNSHLGVGYLRRLHDLFSEERNLGSKLRTHPARSAADLEKLAVAAFNTGEGNVARAQARASAAGLDPGEFSSVEPHLASVTREYVARVLTKREALQQANNATEIA